MTDGTGDFVDIREEVVNEEEINKGKCTAIQFFRSLPHSWLSSLMLCYTYTLLCLGKHRLALKPNSKPKQEYLLELQQVKDDGEVKKGPSEEELWARLDELELQEEMQDERYR